MPFSSYETLPHADPSFPIIFHLDQLTRLGGGVAAHWHESIELLYCISGTARITADMETQSMCAGEISVINSGTLHYITIEPGCDCQYYCLIVDRSLLSEVPLENRVFQKQISDPAVQTYYRQIIEEMEKKSPCYKEAVKNWTQLLFIEMYRRYSSQNHLESSTHQPEMVKKAILYLRENFRDSVTIDEVCSHAGFSKYYFCRVFKKVTGRSVMEYVNYLRCAHARRLLESGGCNISECAFQSGFSDISYFTKVFKKQTGFLPSQIKKRSF